MKKLLFLFSLSILFSFVFPRVINYNVLIPTSLLKNKIELNIPQGFKKMSIEQLKLKYPSSLRPTLVFTDTSGSINVAINHTENPADQKNIESYKENFTQSFTHLFPSAKWIDSGVKQINGKTVGYLELVTPAVDTEIYNLMFFTDFEDQLLLCTFNCTVEKQNNWKESAIQIMNSLKIVSK